jgi:hypothetical protein
LREQAAAKPHQQYRALPSMIGLQIDLDGLDSLVYCLQHLIAWPRALVWLNRSKIGAYRRQNLADRTAFRCDCQ